MVGNDGANILDGGGAADDLYGNGGNDTFVFHKGQANGDRIVDFAGNGAAAGDSLQFVGYGTAAPGRDLRADRQHALADQRLRRLSA